MLKKRAKKKSGDETYNDWHEKFTRGRSEQTK